SFRQTLSRRAGAAAQYCGKANGDFDGTSRLCVSFVTTGDALPSVPGHASREHSLERRASDLLSFDESGASRKSTEDFAAGSWLSTRKRLRARLATGPRRICISCRAFCSLASERSRY